MLYVNQITASIIDVRGGYFLGVKAMAEKTFLMTIDFEKTDCPYATAEGCEHPKLLKYRRCAGLKQPENCPLVALENRGINFDKKRIWREE